MSKLHIAVLRGGPSLEYEVSIKSGAAALAALDYGSHKVVDVFIDKTGQWHRRGIPMNKGIALSGIDVAVIAMHGQYGEDGTVQRELEKLGIPYVGSDISSSILALHKPRARFAVAVLPSITLPEHHLVREDDLAQNEQDGDEGLKRYDEVVQGIFRRFGPPYIVKPVRGGSSIGIQVAQNITELPLIIDLVASEFGFPVLVEQYILGKEVSCAVIDDYRDEAQYALPPIEVRLPKIDGKGKKVFDYALKTRINSGNPDEVVLHCPATITEGQKQAVEQAARSVHTALGLRHYSCSDFIVSRTGQVYFLETNSLPGLSDGSHLSKSLEAVGSNLRDFLEHVIGLALYKK